MLQAPTTAPTVPRRRWWQMYGHGRPSRTLSSQPLYFLTSVLSVVSMQLPVEQYYVCMYTERLDETNGQSLPVDSRKCGHCCPSLTLKKHAGQIIVKTKCVTRRCKKCAPIHNDDAGWGSTHVLVVSLIAQSVASAVSLSEHHLPLTYAQLARSCVR